MYIVFFLLVPFVLRHSKSGQQRHTHVYDFKQRMASYRPWCRFIRLCHHGSAVWYNYTVSNSSERAAREWSTVVVVIVIFIS